MYWLSLTSKRQDFITEKFYALLLWFGFRDINAARTKLFAGNDLSRARMVTVVHELTHCRSNSECEPSFGTGMKIICRPFKQHVLGVLLLESVD